MNPDLLLDANLDNFRLARFIGQGNFGWVYAADVLLMDEVLGCAAVKVLRPEGAEQRAAVVHEASMMSQLVHPGLLEFKMAGEVSDGPAKGCIYIAMELADGTLEQRLKRRGRLDAAEVEVLGRQLSETLAYLHAAGGVHRDLKPANVFWSGGRWKLGDLGLLKAMEGSQMTASGRRGTPVYMAPEVYDGRVGPSVDVWALGALLQQALCGVLPYEASTEPELLKKILQEAPALADGVAEPLRTVISGCLRKEVSSRWTAEQVAAHLSGPSPGSRGVAIGGAPPPPSPAAAVRPSSPSRSTSGDAGVPWFGRVEHDVRGVSLSMVRLPPGELSMGSADDDDQAYDDEHPRHDVILTRGFELGVYPVTQELYEAVVNKTPSYFKGGRRPVECVSWNDAVSFCNALSSLCGLPPSYRTAGEKTVCAFDSSGFRLPTEAEWEYGCRAGTLGRRYGALEKVAWTRDNSGLRTHDVGELEANPWGLYDMLGNVWEWCWDRYSWSWYREGSMRDPTGPDDRPFRVYRGGSWFDYAQFARAADRARGRPGIRDDDLGFRLARTVP